VSIGLVWVVAWLDAYVQTRLDRRD